MRRKLETFELLSLAWTYGCVGVAGFLYALDVTTEPFDTIAAAAFLAGAPLGCLAIGFTWRRLTGVLAAGLAAPVLAGLLALQPCRPAYEGQECVSDLLAAMLLIIGTPFAVLAALIGWFANAVVAAIRASLARR